MKVVAQTHEVSKQRYVPAYGFSIAYAALGDKDQAIQWIAQGSDTFLLCKAATSRSTPSAVTKCNRIEISKRSFPDYGKTLETGARRLHDAAL
jgi:hypothetical protein